MTQNTSWKCFKQQYQNLNKYTDKEINPQQSRGLKKSNDEKVHQKNHSQQPIRSALNPMANNLQQNNKNINMMNQSCGLQNQEKNAQGFYRDFEKKQFNSEKQQVRTISDRGGQQKKISKKNFKNQQQQQQYEHFYQKLQSIQEEAKQQVTLKKYQYQTLIRQFLNQKEFKNNELCSPEIAEKFTKYIKDEIKQGEYLISTSVSRFIGKCCGKCENLLGNIQLEKIKKIPYSTIIQLEIKQICKKLYECLRISIENQKKEIDQQNKWIDIPTPSNIAHRIYNDFHKKNPINNKDNPQIISSDEDEDLKQEEEEEEKQESIHQVNYVKMTQQKQIQKQPVYDEDGEEMEIEEELGDGEEMEIEEEMERPRQIIYSHVQQQFPSFENKSDISKINFLPNYEKSPNQSHKMKQKNQ